VIHLIRLLPSLAWGAGLLTYLSLLQVGGFHKSLAQMAIEAGAEAMNILVFWAVAFLVGAIVCYLGARWAMNEERSGCGWGAALLLLPILGGMVGVVTAFFTIGFFVGGARLGFLTFPAVFFTVPFSVVALPAALRGRLGLTRRSH